MTERQPQTTKRWTEILLPGGGVVITDGEPINEADEPSPPLGTCTCGKPVEPGFLLCLPCWREFHKDEQPTAPWEI